MEQTMSIDDNGVLSCCPQCGRMNRTPFAHLGHRGRCGACKTAIDAIAEPIEIDSDAHFNTVVGDSPVPVLVDFWASWCAPCRTVAPEMEKLARAESSRFVIVKVTTEKLPMLAQRFGIRSIPTMIVFWQGREMDRTMGAQPAEAIKDFVAQAVAP